MITLDSLVWTWPDTPIHLVVLALVAIVVRGLVGWAIRRTVLASTLRTQQHLERLGRPGQILTRASGLDHERRDQRTRTVAQLLGSTASVVIFGVALLTALDVIGLPLQPVLASAGVGGVALAVGAQSLVKDVISGVFMIVEDQYGVGDVITVSDVTGTVEEVGLRTTSIRDANGMLWHLRNGEISKLGNISQGWSIATIDIPVHYSTDPAVALRALQQAADEVEADPRWHDLLLERPKVLGVESIVGQAMTLRVSAKCAANQQYGVAREIRERAKVLLDAAGVQGPA